MVTTKVRGLVSANAHCIRIILLKNYMTEGPVARKRRGCFLLEPLEVVVVEVAVNEPFTL